MLGTDTAIIPQANQTRPGRRLQEQLGGWEWVQGHQEQQGQHPLRQWGWGRFQGHQAPQEQDSLRK